MLLMGVWLIFDAFTMLALRVHIGRRFGIHEGGWFDPLLRREGSWRGRAAILLACVTVTYATTAAFFTAIRMVEGEHHAPARVTVTFDSPAEKAGLRDGDTILSLDEKPVEEFEDLRTILAEAPEGPLQIRVVRGGEDFVAQIVPRVADGTKRIGVTGAPPELRKIGFGRALSLGVRMPVVYLSHFLGSFVKRDVSRESTVAMVREMASSNAGPSPLMMFIHGKALTWPLSILLGIFLVLQ